MTALTFLCLAAVVVDGDTLRCSNIDDANGRVRLARIDAPERREAGFERSTRSLTALIKGRCVTCELVDADPFREGFQDRDRYDRPVARCFAGGRDLGDAQIAAGNARKWP